MAASREARSRDPRRFSSETLGDLYDCSEYSGGNPAAASPAAARDTHVVRAHYLAWLVLATAGVAAQQPPPVFRTSTRLVAVHAAVQDRNGTFIGNLDADDFVVRVNGRPYPVRVFARSSQPLTIALMLETSGGTLHRSVLVSQLARALIDSLEPVDRLAIGSFGLETVVSPLLTSSRDILHRVLAEEFWPGDGPVPVMTALKTGLLRLTDEPGRRVVMVVGNGRQICPSAMDCATPREVRQAALRHDAIVVLVRPLLQTLYRGPGGARLIRHPNMMIDRPVAALLATTGGSHVVVDDGDSPGAVMSELARGLRQRYLLGIEPDVDDGREHRIDVEVRRPGLRVTARDAFVAGSGPS